MNQMPSKRRRVYRERLWKAQSGLCAYCHEPMTPPLPNGTKQLDTTATFDHLISGERAKKHRRQFPDGSGQHGIGNVVLACRKCNQRKGGRTPLEFFMGIKSPRQIRGKKGCAA